MPDVAALLWNYCHTLRHDGIDYGDYMSNLLICCSLRWPKSVVSNCLAALTGN